VDAHVAGDPVAVTTAAIADSASMRAMRTAGSIVSASRRAVSCAWAPPAAAAVVREARSAST
jgi:hypothetical protein